MKTFGYIFLSLFTLAILGQVWQAITFEPVPGCILEGACNYNPNATDDDGSCDLTSCAGCTDYTACDYDPAAKISAPCADYKSCKGCTDRNALNYDADATKDDGSCKQSAWSVTRVSTDRMTNAKQCWANSNSTYGEGLRSPYTLTKSHIGVGYDRSSTWTYLAFSKQPNLTNDETESGYNRVVVNIRFDGKVTKRFTMTQEWGSEYLHFRHDSAIKAAMRKYSTMLVELEWYGSGKVYFEYDLTGASAKMSEARSLVR